MLYFKPGHHYNCNKFKCTTATALQPEILRVALQLSAPLLCLIFNCSNQHVESVPFGGVTEIKVRAQKPIWSRSTAVVLTF